MNKIKFPDDFSCIDHPNVPGATQWLYPKDGNMIISIIGGAFGMHGNGINTFEMFDTREGDIQGDLTKEEINEHIKNNPI